MINREYFEKLYKILPLNVQCDITKYSLQQALIDLKFDLEKTYTVCLGRRNLEFMPNIVQGVINLKLVLDDTIKDDFWYVIDDENKIIIYSPGT